MARKAYFVQVYGPGDTLNDQEEKWRYRGQRASERTVRSYALGIVAPQYPGKLIRVLDPQGTILLEAQLLVYEGGAARTLRGETPDAAGTPNTPEPAHQPG